MAFAWPRSRKQPWMNSCVREKISDIFTGHGTITLIIIIIVIIIAIIYISLLHDDDDEEEEEKDVDGLSQQYRIATDTRVGWFWCNTI